MENFDYLYYILGKITFLRDQVERSIRNINRECIDTQQEEIRMEEISYTISNMNELVKEFKQALKAMKIKR